MKNKSSLKSKIFRKYHYIFDMYIKSKTSPWINNVLYPAYRHRKSKSKSDDFSDIYITQIPNDGAGIGHQMSNFICGVHIARMLGLKYAYPGFKGKEDWEEFFGFYQDSVLLEELKKQGYKTRMLPCFDTNKLTESDKVDGEKNKNNNSKDKSGVEMIKDIVRSYAGQKIVFLVYLDQSYANHYQEIDYIKSRFESAQSRKKDKLIYDKNKINIAVHIRRGDIVKGQQTGQKTLTKRWLDIGYYENVIKGLTEDLRTKYPAKQHHIYIFSEGDADQYRMFENYGQVTYCFDMPAMDCFLHMVRADYLVLSKSSFSYNPALLSDGVRICPPGFWHGYPDDEKWIVAEEDGKIKF